MTTFADRIDAATLGKGTFLDRVNAATGAVEGTDGFSPFMPLGREGTTLDLSRPQRSSQRAAKNEVRKMEREFQRVGKLDDFEQFVAQSGRTGPVGALNFVMEDILNPTFDVLQIGQFTTVGFVQELMRTGSTASAFKQAAIEFGNALPGYESEGARRPSWTDVINESTAGSSPWGASVLGLIMDIVLDPINLIPGGIIASGLRKTAGKAGKSVPESLKKPFGVLFDPNREFKRLGKAGKAIVDLKSQTTAAIENETVRMLDDVDKLVGWMLPQERRLLGAWADQPMILEGQLRELSRTAPHLMEEAVIPDIMRAVSTMGDYTKSQFDELVEHNLFDEHMFRSWYVHGTEVLNKRESRWWEKYIAGRVGDDNVGKSRLSHVLSDILPSKAVPSFAKRRKTKTQADRLMGVLEGTFHFSTETDIKNILIKRSAEHIRWINTKKFLDNIGNNGEIVTKVVDESPAFFKSKAWVGKVKELRDAGVYDVVDVTKRKAADNAKGFEEEVIGAYIMPKPVADAVQNIRKGDGPLGDVHDFFVQADKLTSIWRGWATLSTGYHARNYGSILWQNWMAGVGAEYGKIAKGQRGATSVVKDNFMLRHLQAFKLQTMAEGAGRLPPKVKKFADGMAKTLGFDGLVSIPMPKIIDDATRKVLTPEDIIRIGEAYGVPQTVSRLHNLGDDAVSRVWGDLEKTIPLEDLGSLSPVSRLALTAGANEPKTVVEKLSKIFGNENPMLKANRAFAQIVENNGRWALFLDQFSKGMPPDVAKAATTTWHFDYRNLTKVEKTLFRTLIPFYAWQRFAVPRMIMAMAEQPAKFARFPKAKQAMENLNAEWKDLPQPDYFEEVQAMQTAFVNEEKPVFAQVDIPVLELNRLNLKDIGSSLHPLVKMWSESIPPGGHNIFLDAPIERFPGEASKEFPFLSKSTQHKISSVFPPFARFGTRVARAIDRDEVAELVTSELTGVKLRNLDTRRVIRGNIFQKRELGRQYKAFLKQEGLIR